MGAVRAEGRPPDAGRPGPHSLLQDLLPLWRRVPRVALGPLRAGQECSYHWGRLRRNRGETRAPPSDPSLVSAICFLCQRQYEWLPVTGFPGPVPRGPPACTGRPVLARGCVQSPGSRSGDTRVLKLPASLLHTHLCRACGVSSPPSCGDPCLGVNPLRNQGGPSCPKSSPLRGACYLPGQGAPSPLAQGGVLSGKPLPHSGSRYQSHLREAGWGLVAGRALTASHSQWPVAGRPSTCAAQPPLAPPAARLPR